MTRSDGAALLERIALAYGLTTWQVTAPNRSPERVRVRAICAVALRMAGLSYPEVGRLLGRDHSTVIHACRTLDAAGTAEAAGHVRGVALARAEAHARAALEALERDARPHLAQLTARARVLLGEIGAVRAGL